jgi:hypothetical protein
MCKGLSRIGIGNMHSAFNLRLRTRHYRDGARYDCRRNKLLAVEAGTLKCTENGAWRNFAMIDGKTGYARFASIPCRLANQTIKAHQ